ncbi:D-alanyl-D-alanine carboxypeptidase (penicillin-binding protein 5/6) [Staphylococcus hominis]|uniref:penicillin-binding protein PBP4 n=1 Tax=Staphylococcus hominis TaxID=1290 RepID=UPI001621E145|nr:penicillin-binding protein PBP4 [Staphylococcus hominis]MBB4832076.1 D-alanyl-D-alanine carboxypeptidase (penicillin-binding protein 5/6) [Staphylococcus hominis]
MFLKVTQSIGILSLFTLLGTSISDAAETPIDITNKEGNVAVSSNYEPDGVTLTTQQGQILYNFQGNKEADPASLSKMMTIYLTLEAVHQGKLKLDDKVKITRAYDQLSKKPNLTSVPLNQGQIYTIKDLLTQAALPSSNSAAMILGEQVSGNTSTFTDKMNAQAKAFHMKHTHFVNPAGAANDLLGQQAPKKYKKDIYPKSTSEDIAILSHHLIAKHPKILNITQLSQDTQKGYTFNNTNLSIKHEPLYLKGTDGLKTGTSDKGYNIALTNQQNHLRLNEVVMNVEPYMDNNAKYNRNRIGNAIFKHYREEYEYKKVLSKGEHKIDGKTYKVDKNLYDTVPKDNKKWDIRINKEGKAYVHYKRDFLPKTTYPRVNAKKVWKWF